MQPYYEHNGIAFHAGHVLDVWPALAAQGVRVQTIITSIPYYGLRAYGTEAQVWPDGWVGELGQEDTPDRFVAHIVAVFRAVRQALRPDGTLWLNVGDSYGNGNSSPRQPSRTSTKISAGQHAAQGRRHGGDEKQLLLMPARVALALQADGWILRNECIWHKTAPMPESVTDRFTRAHEQVFVFSQRPRYFMDMVAIAEPTQTQDWRPAKGQNRDNSAVSLRRDGDRQGGGQLGNPDTRNPRDVWTLNPDSYDGQHYAAFPREIPRRAILAGTSARGACPACGAAWRRVMERGASAWEQRKANGEPLRAGLDGLGSFRHMSGPEMAAWKAAHPDRDAGWQPGCRCNAGDPVPCVAADPFLGSGTSAEVAYQLRRHFVGGDLQPAYLDLAVQRMRDCTPWYARADGPAQAHELGPLFAGVA